MAINNTLLIDRDDFLPYVNISSYLSQTRDIDPYILQAQNRFLVGIIGREMLTEIQDEKVSGYWTGENQTLYEDYITPLLVHRTMQLYLSEANTFTTSAGIRVYLEDNSEPATSTQLANLISNQDQAAEAWQSEMLSYLRTNISDFPLFKSYDDGDCSTRHKFLGNVSGISKTPRKRHNPYYREEQ